MQKVLHGNSLLHALYQDDGAFRYGVQIESNSWSSEIVERSRQTASSMVMDAANAPWFVTRNFRTLEIGTRHDGHWFLKEFPEVGQIEDVTIAQSPDGRLGIAYMTSSDNLFFAWIKP